MRLGEELLSGRLRRRLNRFLAEVEVQGAACLAHVPNSGRLRELLVPGVMATLARRAGRGRRSGYDLVAVVHDGVRVCVDARLPGPLLAEAVAAGRLPSFRGFRVAGREVRCGASRLDLLLTAPDGTSVYVETKSVTLVRGGTALFPDAPTARGRRHLEELARAALDGRRAAVVFVVQREDARAWAPHEEADPDFARVLRAVVRGGVEARALRCRVDEECVAVVDELPVYL